MGATHFLTEGLKTTAAEMALHVMAYNVKRVIGILRVQPLLAGTGCEGHRTLSLHTVAMDHQSMSSSLSPHSLARKAEAGPRSASCRFQGVLTSQACIRV